jgi:hypothetical protein
VLPASTARVRAIRADSVDDGTQCVGASVPVSRWWVEHRQAPSDFTYRTTNGMADMAKAKSKEDPTMISSTMQST